jgi:cell division protein FtsB
MRWFTFSISLLSIFLLVALFYIYRQMKKVARARKELSASNEQLKALNIELQVLNNDLSETVHIKEEYIGRYMDLCLNYIDKMDKYRRSLSKIAEHESLEKLYSAIKSTQFLENELKEFYADFDNTFLLLFPTFVKDFNKLLTGELLPKAGERMNTELRIFALIRLGITDSHKIAHFLRYSVTTIFNYRTRIRNISVGDRNDLEKKVMQIGRTVK